MPFLEIGSTPFGFAWSSLHVYRVTLGQLPIGAHFPPDHVACTPAQCGRTLNLLSVNQSGSGKLTGLQIRLLYVMMHGVVVSI